jgi:hypothetical protein
MVFIERIHPTRGVNKKARQHPCQKHFGVLLAAKIAENETVIGTTKMFTKQI